MSTSVCKPLELGRSSASRSLDDSRRKLLFQSDALHKVKRSLFGPVDHEATLKFATEELKKMSTNESTKWNFNFKTEKTLDPDGVFVWKLVTPPRMARNMKRKQVDDDDYTNLYADPRMVPQRVEATTTTNCVSTKKQKQSLMTNYLLETKQFSLASFSKNEVIPAKIPRTTDSS